MEEKFELPIHIEDVDSVTDCWIYNRLAIIKSQFPFVTMHKEYIKMYF